MMERVGARATTSWVAGRRGDCKTPMLQSTDCREGRGRRFAAAAPFMLATLDACLRLFLATGPPPPGERGAPPGSSSSVPSPIRTTIVDATALSCVPGKTSIETHALRLSSAKTLTPGTWGSPYLGRGYKAPTQFI